MTKDIEDTLTAGLSTGYAGGKVSDVNRGGFAGKSSHVQLPNGKIYHDEWFVPSYYGGGQELIQVGDLKYTRLYGGGTPSPTELERLGITPEEVGKYLISKITELKDKTRLFQDCNPERSDDWQYTYKVTGRYPETNVTTSVESITYKGNIVHIHAFILCPVI